MRDSLIRKIAHKTFLKRYHKDKTSLVIDELGLNHGLIRADIAVINGTTHGYEIKGDFDNLTRLPMQVEAYSKIFDKSTLIVGERHLKKALKIIPRWWGIKLIIPRPRNILTFKNFRKAEQNRFLDISYIVKLLWRSEAIEFLQQVKCEKNILRQSKEILYGEILAKNSPSAIKKFVCNKLRTRQYWRCLPQPS